MGLRRLSLWLIISFVVIACSKDKDKQDSLFDRLQLGSPGVTKFDNKIPKQDDTHIFSDEETIKFTNTRGDAVILHSPDREIKEGDIIIGNDEQKLLLKVVEISKSEPGRTEGRTKLANISQLTKKSKTGSFTYEVTPSLSQKKSGVTSNGLYALAPEDKVYTVDESGRLEFRDVELYSLDLNSQGNLQGGLNRILGVPVRDAYQKLDVTAAAGGKMEGKINHGMIEVIPTFRGKNEWSWGSPDLVEARVDALVKLKMDVSYKTEGMIQAQTSFDLIRKIIVPIRIPGAVPVHMDIEFSLPLVVKFEAKKKGETRVVFEAEYAFQGAVSYDGDTDKVSTTQNRDVRVKSRKVTSSTSQNQINAEVSLQPMVTTRLYRVLGPYVYFQPYIRGEVVTPQIEKKDDLFVGVRGGVGVQATEPIFLTTILNLDSGPLFDWNVSWDLDGAGKRRTPSYKFPNINAMENTVSDVTDEGFITIDLKSQGSGDLRFALIEPPKHGHAVASKNIYYDGEIYYFPMGTSKNDELKIALIGPDGQTKTKVIRLRLSEEAIEAAKQDKFGQLTNSTEVAFGNIGDFSDRVARINPVSYSSNSREARGAFVMNMDMIYIQHSCSLIERIIARMHKIAGQTQSYRYQTSPQIERRREGKVTPSDEESLGFARCREDIHWINTYTSNESFAVYQEVYHLEARAYELWRKEIETLNEETFAQWQKERLEYMMMIAKQERVSLNWLEVYETNSRLMYSKNIDLVLPQHEYLPSLNGSIFSAMTRKVWDEESEVHWELFQRLDHSQQKTQCQHNVLKYSWSKHEDKLLLTIQANEKSWCDKQSVSIDISLSERWSDSGKTEIQTLKVHNGYEESRVTFEINAKALHRNSKRVPDLFFTLKYEELKFEFGPFSSQLGIDRTMKSLFSKSVTEARVVPFNMEVDGDGDMMYTKESVH